MMFIHLCEMSISLFSKTYFKAHFFDSFLALTGDKVANVRLKLCEMLPKLKSLLVLPSDKAHLLKLDGTVKAMLESEVDKDVQHVLHKVKQRPGIFVPNVCAYHEIFLFSRQSKTWTRLRPAWTACPASIWRTTETTSASCVRSS